MEQFDSPANEQQYWNSRWQQQQTGWDIGYASPAIVEYMQQYENKGAAILIPGCGNAYEAEALLKLGFTNITLIDIAEELVLQLRARWAEEPSIRIVHGDFFQHQGAYDLIIEQTFFCAIPPTQRAAYAQKTAELLKPDGRIVGLLFNCMFEKAGPPHGGREGEYRQLFQTTFELQHMEPCYNSIPPRAGNELFITLVKKNDQA